MKALVEWFVKNPVAANFLMFGIIGAGVYVLLNETTLEVFPEFEANSVSVSVSYRGATPKEVEESIVVRLEEAVADLEGIEDLYGTAREGGGSISIRVEQDYDARVMLEDVKNRIDAINTFPQEAEKPQVNLAQRVVSVLAVVVSADLTERDLRRLGEQVRDELANVDGLSQVRLLGVRDYEIAVEVDESSLQSYGLSMAEVVRAIRAGSQDIPAGSIRTDAGDVLIRTEGQAYTGEEFAAIPLRAGPDGRRITVGDVATVSDGFEERTVNLRFNGRPSVFVQVLRSSEQSAIEVSELVKAYLEKVENRMPEGTTLSIWNDQSEPVRGRLATLLDSAWMGLALVLIVLALFLRPSLAIWVCIGIPVSMLGAIAVLPLLGVTLNLISLFAFILVLGIVVDDAIVTGESIYNEVQTGDDPKRAAVVGTHRVAVPVTFGVVTTMVAFLPLAMLPGGRGVIFGQIPPIVIAVLFFSIIESKFVLPSHLSHLKRDPERIRNPLVRVQRFIAWLMEAYIEYIHAPVLRLALRFRYLTLVLFLCGASLTFGFYRSGRVPYIFFPRVESEVAIGRLTMPEGTPEEVTARYIQRMEEAAMALQEKYSDADGKSVIRNVLASLGASGFSSGGPRGSRVRSGRSNAGEVSFQIWSPEERPVDVGMRELVNEWRMNIGPVPGAEELNFRAEFGRTRDPIGLELMGPSFEELSAVSEVVRAELAQFDGVFDIEDDFEGGKEEVQLELKPEAAALGLTLADIGGQVRSAFFGSEAQRIQRGRDDVRVMVRYPEQRRSELGSLRSFRVRTPSGTEVPLDTVVSLNMGRGFTAIERVNRNRKIEVTADIQKEKVDMIKVTEALDELLSRETARYPGMLYTLQGEQREQSESMAVFQKWLLIILLVIYVLLAIPFGSYIQPLVVMAAIPFGLVGAVIGHAIMGSAMSIMSIFGMLALTGVVINDSLVLLDYVNQRRALGLPLEEAVHSGAKRRFRAIILTSITTFCGLLPLLFEESTQAQFLIPMAISLGFGILFATVVTLVLVPALLMILEDGKRFVKILFMV